MNAATTPVPLSMLVRDFFGRRLIAERSASTQTVRAYRDTFRLLLRYAERHAAKPLADLALRDLDAPCVLAFLEHLEKDRGNSARTRNARLAAIRSFMRYVSWRDPLSLATVRQVTAIPMKRFEQRSLEFLSLEEMEAHYIREALEKTGGNETKAARLLGMNYYAFRYQKKKLLKG